MGYFTDTNFDSPLDMLDAINDVVERNIRQNFKYVTGESVGLDRRTGSVWINEDHRVIASDNTRSLDYYGGFEYIKEGDGRTTIGDWTFYHGDDRVEDCFDYLENSEQEEAEEE